MHLQVHSGGSKIKMAPSGVSAAIGRCEAVLFDDVAFYSSVLLDPAAATADDFCATDINGDGNVDGLDIQSF